MTYGNTFRADNVSGLYDPQTALVYVSYTGVITPAVTETIYQWGTALVQQVGPEHIRGMITNFSAVEQFDHKTLNAAAKASQQINMVFDLSNLPVGLVVNNLYQEHLVRTSINLTGHIERMRIVYSEAEALAFIEAYHQHHDANSASDDHHNDGIVG